MKPHASIYTAVSKCMLDSIIFRVIYVLGQIPVHIRLLRLHCQEYLNFCGAPCCLDTRSLHIEPNLSDKCQKSAQTFGAASISVVVLILQVAGPRQAITDQR